MTTGSINVRLDKRNIAVCRRNGQPAGQRINTIIDRYAFMVDTLRARVLSVFGELELDELSLALKVLESRRSSAAELQRAWLAGMSDESDTRALLLQMDPIDVVVLAELLEGRQVNLAALT